MKMGKNVFLTGPAGSGKTYVLNQYIEFLKEHEIEVAITASTGIAATHIGGMTIHSWSGIGIKDSLTEYDLAAMEEKQYLWKRFEHVQVLIIDEVSMLKDTLLDSVDMVCKYFKRNTLPFGGIQVIVSGDFFQLPPIEKNSSARRAAPKNTVMFSDDYVYESIEGDNQTPFAFRARSWRDANFHVCYLEEQHRQDDMSLLSILNEIRRGEVSDDSREALLSKIVQNENNDMTKLFTHNVDVDAFNVKKLAELDAKECVYDMLATGKQAVVETAKKGCLSPERLCVKIGALVMFVKNNPQQGYVNGTTGKVVDFEDNYPVVETADGTRHVAYPQTWMIADGSKVLAELSQVPLKLAWAVTIHKSQGMTLDQAHIDLSQSFVPGQGYVALSRIRSLDGLNLKGINQTALEVHATVLRFDQTLRKLSDNVRRRIALTEEARLQEHMNTFVRERGSKKSKTVKKSPYEITADAVLAKKTIAEMCLERELTEKTVFKHLEKILELKLVTLDDISYLKPKTSKEKKVFAEIQKAFKKLGVKKLKPIYEYFDEKYDYRIIELARIFMAE